MNPRPPTRRPLVSIGLSVRNGAPFIEDAIRSIRCQTYPRWELLVFDDGSTDGTAELIRRFRDPRIRLFTDSRSAGLPARLNALIDEARGDLFARMDGDDIAYPDRLEKQVRFLQDHPEVDVVATRLLVFRSDGMVDGEERWRGGRHEDIVRSPWNGFHFNHATWCGRLAWFRRFRYRPDAVRTEDDDLMLRAYRHSRFAMLPEILYGYRIDELSLRKILRARYSFTKVLVRETRRQRDLRLLRGVPGQAIRAAVDLVAVGTGLGYRLLGHRAAPPPSDVLRRWEAVLAEVRAVGYGTPGQGVVSAQSAGTA